MAQLRERNQARARAIGLLAGAPTIPAVWATPPSEAQAHSLAAFDARIDARAATARMQSHARRAATVLGVAEEFFALPDMAGAVPFRRLRHAADTATSWYNERMLARFSNFVRETRWVRGATVSTYTSSLRTLIEADHRGPIVLAPPYGGKHLSELHTAMRREDGPRGERRVGRALRMQHIRALVARGEFEMASRQGHLRHAVRHAALQCLLRPGELGVVDGQPFEPALHLTCGPDVLRYRSAAQARQATPVMAIMIVAIKDVAAKRVRTPSLVAKVAPDGQRDDDPCCPHAVLRAWHRRRLAEIEEAGGDPAEAPLFAHPDGRAVQTCDVTAWNKEDARLLGLDPSEYFGNAWRVGGATDLLEAPHAAGGPTITVPQATALIKARGRWWTDIYEIYSRWSVAEHSLASRAIASADGLDLEDMLPGFTQPGR